MHQNSARCTLAVRASAFSVDRLWLELGEAGFRRSWHALCFMSSVRALSPCDSL